MKIYQTGTHNVGKEYKYEDFWLRVMIQGEELFTVNETFEPFDKNGEKYIRIIKQNFNNNIPIPSSDLCQEFIPV